MATINPYNIERAMGKLREFRSWREDNPRAWIWAEQYALDAAAAGQHVGGAAIVEAIRCHDFADKHGRPTRTNNDYAPIIIRELVKMHPTLREHIELRGSMFDAILGVADDD